MYAPLESIKFDSVVKPHLEVPEYHSRNGKQVLTYINCPFAIDIETTSTMDGIKEIAYPYCYQVGINNKAFITRDYKAFYQFIQDFDNWLKNQNRYIICLIHNLPYEFTFFSGFLEFTDVFAKTNGHPLVCNFGNIRFMDSLQMSGFSLQKLAKNFTKTQKIKDINYNTYRVPQTKLTQDEIRYCCDDVIILNEYWNTPEIQRYIKKQGYTKLPLTSTAKARMRVRENIPQNKRKELSHLLWNIYPDFDTWEMLDKAFMGGIVKSNARLTDIVINNVHCVDLKSSYPASMLKFKYPMSQFIDCELKSVEDIDPKQCYLIRAKLTNVKSKHDIRTISASKVDELTNATIDNGRIITADSLILTYTDIDFKYLFDFYDFDYEIIKAKSSIKGRLPKYLIKTLHQLFCDKTRIGDLLHKDENNEDLRADYMHTKSLLNSLYGMCVAKDHIINYEYVNGKWQETLNEKYHQFNENDFLSFQWGCFISAYSRAMLLEGIKICSTIGDDGNKCEIIYSDTDSCKYVGVCDKGFNAFNIKNDKLVRTACAYYGIKYEDMKGIGRYEKENDVAEFKTLGSKRYYHDGTITISGISNNAFCEYAKKIGKTPLEFFTNGATIPPEYTNKNTSKYYLNNTEPYIYKYEYEGKQYELPIINYIYMCGASWSMTLAQDYKALLLKLKLLEIKKGEIQ